MEKININKIKNELAACVEISYFLYYLAILDSNFIEMSPKFINSLNQKPTS